ncbi:hypothetical protein [Brachybacterium phenoliresistens]|uniref:hypothetical protein n=1 Tax=Brachybacterium phenoliresistens TaxID=396014 RepID=UPI0031E13596
MLAIAHRRRAALPVLAASLLLALSGCGIVGGLLRPDVPEPTLRTVPAEVLARSAEACGTREDAPTGDVSFEASVERSPEAQPSGMTLPLTVTVQLASGHGEHSAGPGGTRGVLVGEEGMVAGLVTAVTVTDEGRPRDGAQTGAFAVELGACPVAGIELGAPLPDGDYSLVLHGTVSPLDHNHGQQEYWIAPGVDVAVSDGAIVP